MIWTLKSIESSRIHERDCTTETNIIYRKVRQRDGYIVVTSDALGSPSLVHQTTIMPISQVFSEYGRLHAVYATRGGKIYLLDSLFYSEPLAEAYVDLLDERQDTDTIILTSMYSEREIKKTMDREELDDRGHHYVK